MIDPLRLAEHLWPDVRFYDRQVEIIYSVWNDPETVVPAGNMLGKDFVAAFLVLAFFLTRHPCKIVTTSVKDRHLNVLWGEIEKFIRIARFPLLAKQGGPLIVNADGICKVIGGKPHKDIYVMRMVANPETLESFQGHHVTPDPGQDYDPSVPLNLFVADEASGVPDAYYDMASTWARRKLIFGNTWSCNNFFYRAVKGDAATGDPGGSLFDEHGRCLRRVIHITGHDSPNVRQAKSELSEGEVPSGKTLVPGVLPYDEYQKRIKTWDKYRKTVSIDAQFYEGEEIDMFPAEWMDAAVERHKQNSMTVTPRSLGVDSAAGGDNTSWAVCGTSKKLIQLLMLHSKKTRDTTEVPSLTKGFIKQYKLRPENVLFDAGGGGREHADRLRKEGYNVRTVGFGESAKPQPRTGMTPTKMRVEQNEDRYVYKNRRSEMYGILRRCFDPNSDTPIAVPGELIHRRRPDGGPSLYDQLRKIPIRYDGEGRMYLLPKNRKDADDDKCLVELIGCSPDEADALVLAVYDILKPKYRVTAGAA